MGNEGGALQGAVRMKTVRIWALIWESYMFEGLMLKLKLKYFGHLM